MLRIIPGPNHVVTIRAAVLAWLALATVAGAAGPAFKILVERPGACRVSFEDLVAAGHDGSPLPAAGLGLTNGGEPVAVWVEDGGDGSFGPGDELELVGEGLRGEYSYASEYTRYNVYFLRFDHRRPARMKLPEAPPGPDAGFHALRSLRHLEEDLLILRLPPPPDGSPEELWYWAKLVQNQPEPFARTLDLPDLDARSGATADLRIALRGWSQPKRKADPEMADHRVDVTLNGQALASTEWNGTQPHLLEIPALPVERFVRGGNALGLAVPGRPDGEDGKALIDVVMLNWIEIDYPRGENLGDAQARFVVGDPVVVDPAAPAALRLTREPGREFVVYGDGGTRYPSSAMTRRQEDDVEVFVFRPAAGDGAFVAAGTDAFLAPTAVVPDRPSRLADAGNRADYVMIAHRRLLEAIRPLARFHRSRGLAVEVVDVEDVYDEFSHGIVHPGALRAFLAHAHQFWQRPAPRYVLLVGDASWDSKNTEANDANYADWTYRPGESSRFGKNLSTPYAESAELNHRGLVPTWNHSTHQGHSASDNYFVAVAGEDHLPDMAIGRLPVVDPEEVARIVAKTVRYAAQPEVGPWRRNVLFITNESRGFQRQSDRLADLVVARGYAPEKIFPESQETSNEHHTARILESFDRGQLVVHFLGHGGRYIWRTGPPDLKKNHDLFTLDHLDELRPTGRLPVVLSLTCYSAPFDHPNADSIGEKLLRLGDRGAVAVLAASWRNTPVPHWGRVLLEELTRPGATVGEAVTEAKRRIGERIFVETYNLLGDPAVPVALPAGRIELATTPGRDGGLRVAGVVEADFAGMLLVDMIGPNGELLESLERELDGPEFTVEVKQDLTALTAVRAYAWNVERGVDAVGAVWLAPPADERPLPDARERARRLQERPKRRPRKEQP